MADDALARSEVCELLPQLREASIPISAVYPSQRHLPARTRAFIEFVAGLQGLTSRRPKRLRKRADYL